LSKLKVLINKLLSILQHDPLERITVSCLKHIIHDMKSNPVTYASLNVPQNEFPVIFHGYFDENETVYEYDTRQKCDLHFYAVNSRQ